VILDKHTLGLADSFFHCMQLLSYVYTGAAVFDHGYDAAQMTFCALQSFDDVLMALVLMSVLVFAHDLSLVRR